MSSSVFQQLTLEGKPFIPNELLPFRYITIEEQKKFVDFLGQMRLITTDEETKLCWCSTEYEKYRCSSNHDHTRVTRYLGCGLRGICPRCSMGYAHKRAGIMFTWIKNNVANHLNFDLKVNQLTLTLPEGLHEIDQKLFIKIVKHFMSKLGIESYGYSIQDDHSRDPLGQVFKHCHVLTLNMKEDNGVMVQNDYFFKPEMLQLLWKSTIEQFTDLKIQGKVNLHNEYASFKYKPTQVKHLFAYLYRYPIQDVFHTQVRKRSINYLEKQQIKYSEALHLRTRIKTKPRLVWCGWLSSGKRKRLIELLGISKFDWLDLVDVEKLLDKRAKTCRDCSHLLEERPFERGLYDGKNEPRPFFWS